MKDKVGIIPGQVIQPPSQWYSGYYDITKTKSIHYIYSESQGNPASDPLIVFLLGGPGVASISFGMFGGLGPLLLNASS